MSRLEQNQGDRSIEQVAKAVAEVVREANRDTVLQALVADRFGQGLVRVHHQNACHGNPFLSVKQRTSIAGRVPETKLSKSLFRRRDERPLWSSARQAGSYPDIRGPPLIPPLSRRVSGRGRAGCRYAPHP